MIPDPVAHVGGTRERRRGGWTGNEKPAHQKWYGSERANRRERRFAIEDDDEKVSAAAWPPIVPVRGASSIGCADRSRHHLWTLLRSGPPIDAGTLKVAWATHLGGCYEPHRKWLVLGLVVIVGLGVAGWVTSTVKTDPETAGRTSRRPNLVNDQSTDSRQRRMAGTVTPAGSDTFVGLPRHRESFANISDPEGPPPPTTGSEPDDRRRTIRRRPVTATCSDSHVGHKAPRHGPDSRDEGLESDRSRAKFVFDLARSR